MPRVGESVGRVRLGEVRVWGENASDSVTVQSGGSMLEREVEAGVWKWHTPERETQRRNPETVIKVQGRQRDRKREREIERARPNGGRGEPEDGRTARLECWNNTRFSWV